MFIHLNRSLPQIFAVQHVDVCMFSNGKFKNIVAEVDVSKQIGPGETLHGVYSLLPIRGMKTGKTTSSCLNPNDANDDVHKRMVNLLFIANRFHKKLDSS